MKKTFLYLVMAVFAMVVFNSCSSDRDEEEKLTNTNKAKIVGKWKVIDAKSGDTWGWPTYDTYYTFTNNGEFIKDGIGAGLDYGVYSMPQPDYIIGEAIDTYHFKIYSFESAGNVMLVDFSYGVQPTEFIGGPKLKLQKQP